MKEHVYTTTCNWVNVKPGAEFKYDAYSRDHMLQVPGKLGLQLSSDAAFRGNSGLHNPEELLLASVSSCHMLWYLHLCSSSGINVLLYTDVAEGTMQEQVNGSGKFTQIILHPVVTIADAAHTEQALNLHANAHKMCFIANSCNFDILHLAKIIVKLPK